MQQSEQQAYAPLPREPNEHSTNVPQSVVPWPPPENSHDESKGKRHNGALRRLWRKGWTAETCSCIFALLSLLGLVATLVAHQNNPIPKWPQLVSINSIVSLFSLLIRGSVGMVLTEGMSATQQLSS